MSQGMFKKRHRFVNLIYDLPNYLKAIEEVFQLLSHTFLSRKNIQISSDKIVGNLVKSMSRSSLKLLTLLNA